MPNTRKQKSKTKKAREAEMLSDIENMDKVLGSNHFEREDSEFVNLARRSENPSYDALVDHNTNSHSNARENEIRRFARNLHDSGKMILVAG